MFALCAATYGCCREVAHKRTKKNRTKCSGGSGAWGWVHTAGRRRAASCGPEGRSPRHSARPVPSPQVANRDCNACTCSPPDLAQDGADGQDQAEGAHAPPPAQLQGSSEAPSACSALSMHQRCPQWRCGSSSLRNSSSEPPMRRTQTWSCASSHPACGTCSLRQGVGGRALAAGWRGCSRCGSGGAFGLAPGLSWTPGAMHI